jgi:hypothetical protein
MMLWCSDRWLQTSTLDVTLYRRIAYSRFLALEALFPFVALQLSSRVAFAVVFVVVDKSDLLSLQSRTESSWSGVRFLRDG